MGLSFSCPGANLEESFEDLLMRSISFSENVKSTLRSVSFNGRDAEPTILKTWGSGKLFIEGSLSFNRRQTDSFHLETKIPIPSPRAKKDDVTGSAGLRSSRFNPLRDMAPQSPVIQLDSPRHEAAVTLQKVYKSFRTRRQLADCAVLVEQRWWKLLDFALLKRSSVSFFDIEKPETAVSRWSRARTRAAKVGKGLSKDEKAQKLALQHWLEAIDPRHRYGHNLQYYYHSWLRCESSQPFFYWLDVGEGKEVNLEEQCPRSKLQQQCIKYLGPKEREAYEVVLEDGKFVYKKSMQILDTSESPKDVKWIFVLCTSKRLYVGQKKKGLFQHSSFLAGGATSAAGRLEVEKGILKAVWPHSGHYRPTEQNFQEFMSFLKENNVDLTDVKKSPIEEDEDRLGRSRSGRNISERKSCTKPEDEDYSSRVPDVVRSNMATPEAAISFEPPQAEGMGGFPAVTKLEGDKTVKKPLTLDLCHNTTNAREDSEGEFEEVEKPDKCSTDGEYESAEDSSSPERRYMFCKQNLFAEEQEEDEEAAVPQELILRRINSKKGLKSYQLGKQLSFKWTTGAGPRIGCVRDYPSELQFRALEQVSLSPRGAGPCRFASPRHLTDSPKLPEMPSPKEAPQPQHKYSSDR